MRHLWDIFTKLSKLFNLATSTTWSSVNFSAPYVYAKHSISLFCEVVFFTFFPFFHCCNSGEYRTWHFIYCKLWIFHCVCFVFLNVNVWRWSFEMVRICPKWVHKFTSCKCFEYCLMSFTLYVLELFAESCHGVGAFHLPY